MPSTSALSERKQIVYNLHTHNSHYQRERERERERERRREGGREEGRELRVSECA